MFVAETKNGMRRKETKERENSVKALVKAEMVGSQKRFLFFPNVLIETSALKSRPWGLQKR